MIHVGDITKLTGAALHPVDTVIGGSPCQDLSAAGKRAGLAGARSGLFMEQIRVVKELRDADIHRGRTGQFIRPRFMVWENVPGAFSSNKGEDFRVVLEEIARVADTGAVIPGPPGGRWRSSGCVMGDGWSIAWRVLDAQFWGVPQRRRRIALIADFGGHAAPEILFIRKSVCGDIDEGAAAGESPAPGAGNGTYPAVANCLKAKANLSFRGDSDTLVYSFSSGQGAKAGGIGYAKEVSPTLKAAASGSNRSPCVFENHGQDSRLTGPPDVAPTVAQKFGTGGNNTPLVLAQQRFGEPEPILLESNQNHATIQTGGVSTTLPASMGMGGGYVPMVVAGLDCRNGTENRELCATLQAKANGGQSLNCTHPVRVGKTVRRLTPLECERLQGFPDGWTDIGPWVDGKGKVHKESSDSARYKALGNSIALPPWRWVLTRIAALYERPATMGSLFDGIGGFSLIWERLNGPGTALWASEIEEFPMAVTRYRFAEEVQSGHK